MFFPTIPSQQSQPPVKPEKVGRNGAILVGALMAGLIAFTVMAMLISWDRKPQPPDALNFFALGFAAVSIVTWLVIPRLVTAAASRRVEGQTIEERRAQLAGVYLQKKLISSALLEGAGFFNCIAIIITGSPLNIGAVAVLLAIMAVTFPSQTQFENWADQIQRDSL